MTRGVMRPRSSQKVNSVGPPLTLDVRRDNHVLIETSDFCIGYKGIRESSMNWTQLENVVYDILNSPIL